MLYREIIAVCSEIHTKHINTAVWVKFRMFYVKIGDAYSKHWAFKLIDSDKFSDSAANLYRDFVLSVIL
jgi:hypothetical protein